ncbi:MAG: hypothetical protein ACYDH4_10145 [Candidatus Cryosericum sp.]
MSQRINTSYVCDACGREMMSATASMPEGWNSFSEWLRGIRLHGAGVKIERHACTIKCYAEVLRKIAEEIDPTPKDASTSLSQGGPYR